MGIVSSSACSICILRENIIVSMISITGWHHTPTQVTVSALCLSSATSVSLEGLESPPTLLHAHCQ